LLFVKLGRRGLTRARWGPNEWRPGARESEKEREREKSKENLLFLPFFFHFPHLLASLTGSDLISPAGVSQECRLVKIPLRQFLPASNPLVNVPPIETEAETGRSASHAVTNDQRFGLDMCPDSSPPRICYCELLYYYYT